MGPAPSTIPNVGIATENFGLKEGHTWIKTHVQPRYELFVPLGSLHGPSQPGKLRPTRRTTCYVTDGTEPRFEGGRKIVGSRTLAKQWRGAIELGEDVKLPLDPPVLYARSPKALAAPTEPTPREREPPQPDSHTLPAMAHYLRPLQRTR